MKKLKPDLVVGRDGNQVLIEYFKVRKGDGRVYVEVGLRGYYAIKITDLLKKNGSWDDFFVRTYASKGHARSIVLPLVKDLVKRIDLSEKKFSRRFFL